MKQHNRSARLPGLYRYISISSAVAARSGGFRPVRDRNQVVEDDTDPSFDEAGYQPAQNPILNRFKSMAEPEFDMKQFTERVRGGRDIPNKHTQSAFPKLSGAKRTPITSLQDGPESWRTKPAAEYDSFGLEREPELPQVETRPTRSEKIQLGTKLSGEKTPRQEKPKARSTPSEISSNTPTERTKKANKESDRKSTRSLYPYLTDKDPLFKQTMSDVKNRTIREKNRKILLEGHRLINEALMNGVRVKTIFFSHLEQLNEISGEGLRLMKSQIYQVSPKQMTLWSDMTTPPGIVAISNTPDPDVMDCTNQMPLTVVLDNIRDPGNMGAIIRNLAGASCSRIICMKKCVDPWESKVLRSAMGAHFHVPIQCNVEWASISDLLPNPATVYLADNLEERAPGAHVVMGEQRGTRMFPKKQPDNLPIVPFHHADFREGSIVMIIGGETSGVSDDAYLVAMERRGAKLTIPLGNYVESLNAASAVAILAFEMRRQRLLLDTDMSARQSDMEEEQFGSDEESGSEFEEDVDSGHDKPDDKRVMPGTLL